MKFRPLCFDYHWDAITATDAKRQRNCNTEQSKTIWILPCPLNQEDNDDVDDQASVTEAPSSASHNVDDAGDGNQDDGMEKAFLMEQSDIVDSKDAASFDQQYIATEAMVVAGEVDDNADDDVEMAPCRSFRNDVTTNDGTMMLVANHQLNHTRVETYQRDFYDGDLLTAPSPVNNNLIPTGLIPPPCSWPQHGPVSMTTTTTMTSTTIIIPSIQQAWLQRQMHELTDETCVVTPSLATSTSHRSHDISSFRNDSLRLLHGHNRSVTNSIMPSSQQYIQQLYERYDGDRRIVPYAAGTSSTTTSHRDVDFEIRQAFWLGVLIAVIGLGQQQQQQQQQCYQEHCPQQQSVLQQQVDVAKPQMYLPPTQIQVRHQENEFHAKRKATELSTSSHPNLPRFPLKGSPPGDSRGQLTSPCLVMDSYDDAFQNDSAAAALKDAKQEIRQPCLHNLTKSKGTIATNEVDDMTTNQPEPLEAQAVDASHRHRHKKAKRHKTKSRQIKQKHHSSKELFSSRDELIRDSRNDDYDAHEALWPEGARHADRYQLSQYAKEQPPLSQEPAPAKTVREKIHAPTSRFAANVLRAKSVPAALKDANLQPLVESRTDMDNDDPPMTAKSGLRFPPGFLDVNQQGAQLSKIKLPQAPISPTTTTVVPATALLPSPPLVVRHSQSSAVPTRATNASEVANLDTALSNLVPEQVRQENEKSTKKDRKKDRKRRKKSAREERGKRQKIHAMDVDLKSTTVAGAADTKGQESTTSTRVSRPPNQSAELANRTPRLGKEVRKIDGDGDLMPIGRLNNESADTRLAKAKAIRNVSNSLRSSLQPETEVTKKLSTEGLPYRSDYHSVGANEYDKPDVVDDPAPARRDLSFGLNGLTPFKLLCSESFLENSSEVVAELASGRWASSFYVQPSTEETEFLPNQAVHVLGRKIELYDSSLVDKCDVDIELSGRRGIIVSNLESWERSDEGKFFTRRLVQLAAIGRYKTLHIILCAGSAISGSIATQITQLQNAVLRHGVNPPTCCITRLVSQSSLSAMIVHCAFSSVGSSYEAISGHYDVVRDAFTSERIRFLLGIVPTLTVGGAIQLLKQNSKSPSNESLTRHSGRAFHRLLTTASFGGERESFGDAQEIHPAAVQQLSYALNVFVGQPS